MKKNKLGITNKPLFIRPQSSKRDVFFKGIGSDELFATVYRQKINTEYEKQAEIDALFIADSFNTANKCGLLPSELLEQNALLLEALIQIRTVGGLYLDGKLSKIIRDTINQIEQ